jgi:hypothetical protein
MIRLFLILVVVAVGGYFAYGYLYPEKRACQRLLTDLCHSGNEAADRQQCEELFKRGGRDIAQSSADCIAKSGSCGQAVGCVAGSAGKMGVSFFGDFLKGAERTFNSNK